MNPVWSPLPFGVPHIHTPNLRPDFLEKSNTAYHQKYPLFPLPFICNTYMYMCRSTMNVADTKLSTCVCHHSICCNLLLKLTWVGSWESKSAYAYYVNRKTRKNTNKNVQKGTSTQSIVHKQNKKWNKNTDMKWSSIFNSNIWETPYVNPHPFNESWDIILKKLNQ